MKPLTMKLLKILLCLTLACFLIACSSEDGEGDDSGSDDISSDSGVSGEAFASTCGVIIDGDFSSDVPSDQLELVSVNVSTAQNVVVTRQEGEEAGNQQAIKLHGVTTAGVNSFFQLQGEELIRELTTPVAFLVQSGDTPECQFNFPGGAVGTFGQLFSANGVNINEALLAQGSVIPTVEGCMDSELAGCYASIEIEENISPTTVSNFLWKPVSERDGNLVILIDPFNVAVIVNGEALVDFGPSNSRGTTARANQSGASFGANAVVEFFDSQGRRVLLSDGRSEVIIPSGASRVEFTL